MTAPFTFGAASVSTLWAILAFVINTFRPQAGRPAAPQPRSAGKGVLLSAVMSSLFPPDSRFKPSQRLITAAWSP